MHAPPADSRADVEAEGLDAGPLEPIVAGVAHEFGNILAVITNYASLASRRVEDPTTAELLDKVRIASRRAARLNRQLHDLGECGTLAVQPVVVNDLVRDARPLLAEGLREGCHLHLDLGEEPLEAQANRAGLEMALRHLLDNACDALPDGGTITIGARPLAGTAADPGVEISVSDQGVGMGPDALAQALEPRYSTQPKGQTSGLGLTIVDRVVRSLGGRVRLESEEGSGTTVRLQLAGVSAGG